MLLTLPVGESSRCSRRARKGVGGGRFAIRTDGNKLVHEFSVGNNRVDQCHQEVLLFGRKLVEEVLIAQVKGAEEEHDLENLRDCHRRTREGQKMPLEAGTKLVDPLLVTLPVNLNKRDSRAVKVLEMEEGWKLSSRTWSISKPLS